jgi:phage tail sheath protein FI
MVDPEAVADAQQAVVDAQAALDAAQAGGDQAAIDAAQAALDAAEQALAAAQSPDPPDIAAGSDDMSAAIGAAREAVDDATDDLRGAQRALRTAQRALARAEAKQPPDQAEIDAAQAAVDAAQAAADAAQAALATATDALATAEAATGASDGDPISRETLVPDGAADQKLGLYALMKTDIFNLLCIPPYTHDSDVDTGTLADALQLCVEERAILLVDPPLAWNSFEAADAGADDPPVSGAQARNAAIYFPRLLAPDPENENRLTSFAPSGAVAGVIARTDAERGVWKAPAGIDASLNGARGLSVELNDLENGRLNIRGINNLRTFPIFGRVVWGARTLRGADQLANEWKYLPVRRLALYIEETLFRNTKWVVFEPNDEPLWASIRLNVGAFMNSLYRRGAFQGRTPREAYLVKCDRENNPQNDIDRGIVNIRVGFAPLKPAEFVIIQIQQIAPEPVA